ncbi:conserved Plasmodium protein, unknown function [Plasmodium knowlesi strain H]|uniref:AP5B1 C-terminal domain-containing protein n=3 Tax=Plasmodium knowlesi TaxID=5850 RepID=A0A5K1VAC4_PLAKH|nr:conserved Plasmodium protein, unknown function [Plasmodium knowlesi strain H]OTN63834.1 Uncharacterized protein PKNOH_S140257500 [Plasmodium knowlesi]CAA9990990.1 conserved Plasmodium protein, unknown function [Plasmodium knowlesi strain H]SBO20750.1 conserved Plasmodium protein, unknown function [Plasmodium knowlesi strain H]SBO21202.1 conserved Plasmodium protein, unknown function [Plasmodium knowlesi strain H]VVS80464.1 conserved Plasmodium protein, unknown function [Plasmodium knowlesi |eukprot:XP_002262272.1 hypothetical protein, conserved in Plasmodium species [Plasmodium knowlesi strain H]
MGVLKKKQKLDEELLEIIIYNILSLIIVNGELSKTSAKNRIIDSIIVKNVDYIMNKCFFLSLGNIQKLLFVIDLILNDEVVYYEFGKVRQRENAGTAKNVEILKIEEAPICKSSTVGAHGVGTMGSRISRVPVNDGGKDKADLGRMQKCARKELRLNRTDARRFTDRYSLNNYIKDIFLYIEEKNIYLSLFHFNYIFKNSADYQQFFLRRYQSYTFETFSRDIMKLADGGNRSRRRGGKLTLKRTHKSCDSTNKRMNMGIGRSVRGNEKGIANLLYIKKKKYTNLYDAVIKYHKENFNLMGKGDNGGAASSSSSSSFSSSSFTSFSASSVRDHTSSVPITSNGTTAMRGVKWTKGGTVIPGMPKKENNANAQNSNNYKSGNEEEGENKEYVLYDIISREKIKRLYKYKKHKCKLIENNNFVTKSSYIPINLFPNNNLHVNNIKFQTLSSSIRVKMHLVILFTNLILIFDLLNSSLYPWVYKFISFLLNVLNNFNCKFYDYLDNSSLLSHFNKEKLFILNKTTWDHNFVTKVRDDVNRVSISSSANSLPAKGSSILKKLVQKNAKKDNRINLNFPYTNCGYIEIYDSDKNENAKKLYFHHFVSVQILKYYSILSLYEIENLYKGILSCLLGDIYNRTITTICMFEREGSHYSVSPPSRNNMHFKNNYLKNNNIDLYTLIGEFIKLRCNNKSEEVVINALRYLYLFVLFNYITIWGDFSIAYNFFAGRDQADPCAQGEEDNVNNYSNRKNVNADNSCDGKDTHNMYDFRETVFDRKKLEDPQRSDVADLINQINLFARENQVRLELQEFCKSIQVSEGVRTNSHFCGSLITLPFYVNVGVCQMIGHVRKMEKLNGVSSDEKGFADRFASCNEENPQDEYPPKGEKRRQKRIIAIRHKCKKIIQKRITKLLSRYSPLVFHFTRYAPLFASTLADILKKNNYFLYQNDSYRFSVCVNYLYMLYEEVNESIIVDFYEKIILVIKNGFYTHISKIIIIYIFSFFLKKELILNLCERDINQFFPSFSDSKDLAIIKYYFVLKFVQYRPIPIKLEEVHKKLYTYHHYAVVGDTTNNGNPCCSEFPPWKDHSLGMIPSQKYPFCKYTHEVITDSATCGGEQSSSHRRNLHPIVQSPYCKEEIRQNSLLEERSSLVYTNEWKRDCNTCGKKLQKTRLRLMFDSRESISQLGVVSRKEEEEEKNANGRSVQSHINALYRKRANVEHAKGAKSIDKLSEVCVKHSMCSENTLEEDHSGYPFPEKNNLIYEKKIYFLIFAYHLLKCNSQSRQLAQRLKVELLHMLVSNMNSIHIIYFMLHYLHEKKDLQLFCAIQNGVLKCLMKMKPSYKLINFLAFFFYLVKIKYTNVKAIMKMLSQVFKKYEFNLKVYMVMFKIIKVLLQRHEISDSYPFILSILRHIKESDYVYLHTTCMYYINIIQNKISFLECTKFGKKRPHYRSDLTEADANSLGDDPERTQRISSINVKYEKKNDTSNFIKLKIHKLDRRKLLSLKDNGSTIFYAQRGATSPDMVPDGTLSFPSDHYYNSNDFSSDSFYSIYRDDSYSLKNYCTYIATTEQCIYFPFILRYSLGVETTGGRDTHPGKRSHIGPKNVIRVAPSNILHKTERGRKQKKNSKRDTPRGDPLWNPNETLFCLNVCFVHKGDFVNIHNVYIPYIQLSHECPISKYRCSGKEKDNEGVEMDNRYEYTWEEDALFRRLPRRRKILSLKKKNFSIVRYSCALYKGKVRYAIRVLIRGLKRGRGSMHEEPSMCKSKGHYPNDAITKPESRKKKHIADNQTHGTHFADLKRDVIKKEAYKINCMIKGNPFLKREKCHVGGIDGKVNQSRNETVEKTTSSYKLLIKIGVKLLIKSKFYAYIVYINREKKTFKRFLGKYNLNFADFFQPFRANIQFWKNIFEDVWNGKIGKMYKSSKYLNMTSDKVLQIIKKKLHPFVVQGNVNVKNWNVYNFRHYKMHVGRNYCLNEKYYYAYGSKNRKINNPIFDEFYIDNYPLGSSETDGTTSTTTSRMKAYNLRANGKTKKKETHYLRYKPNFMNTLLNDILRHSLHDNHVDVANLNKCDKGSAKVNRAKNRTILKRNNNERTTFSTLRVRRIFHLNINRMIRGKGKCTKRINQTDGDSAVRKIIKKGNPQHDGHSKYKINPYFSGEEQGKKCRTRPRTRTNHDLIKKFVGIFLPPKHHLLMVFHIHEWSTAVQIRTDNLNALNYLNSFFDECTAAF